MAETTDSVLFLSDEAIWVSVADNFTNNTNINDMDESCKKFLFVLHSVIMTAICVPGLIGTIVSFVVLRSTAIGGTSMPVTFLLQVLSVANGVFLLLWFFQFSLRFCLNYINSPITKTAEWLYLRVGEHPLLYMTQSFTIWIVVFIAINQFVAVCKPYAALRLSRVENARKIIVGVLLFSVISNLPRYGEIVIIRQEDGSTSWERTELWKNKWYRLIYIDIFYYIFSFILPILILFVANIRVIVTYRSIQRRRRQMTTRVRASSSAPGRGSGGEDGDEKDRRCAAIHTDRVTLAMIVVIAIFILSQTPARLVQLFTSYQYQHCRQTPVPFTFIHVSMTLEALNSSVNAVVYFIFYPRFREALFRCVTSRRRCVIESRDTDDTSIEPAASGRPHNTITAV